MFVLYWTTHLLTILVLFLHVCFLIYKRWCKLWISLKFVYIGNLTQKFHWLPFDYSLSFDFIDLEKIGYSHFSNKYIKKPQEKTNSIATSLFLRYISELFSLVQLNTTTSLSLFLSHSLARACMHIDSYVDITIN